MHPLASIESRMIAYTGLRWEDVASRAYAQAGDILDDAHTRITGDIAINAAIHLGTPYAVLETHLGWSFSALHASSLRARHLIQKSVIAECLFNILTQEKFS